MSVFGSVLSSIICGFTLFQVPGAYGTFLKSYVHTLDKKCFSPTIQALYGLVFVKGEILRLTYISYTNKKTEMLFFNKRLFNLNFSYREIRFEIVKSN